MQVKVWSDRKSFIAAGGKKMEHNRWVFRAMKILSIIP